MINSKPETRKRLRAAFYDRLSPLGLPYKEWEVAMTLAIASLLHLSDPEPKYYVIREQTDEALDRISVLIENLNEQQTEDLETWVIARLPRIEDLIYERREEAMASQRRKHVH